MPQRILNVCVRQAIWSHVVLITLHRISRREFQLVKLTVWSRRGCMQMVHVHQTWDTKDIQKAYAHRSMMLLFMAYLVMIAY